MKIWISSLAKVHTVAQNTGPSKIVSLLGPGTRFPEFRDYGPDRHLTVELDDDREVIAGRLTPTEAHVAGLIEFLGGWNPETPLLVHCWAGMSRSTASALIAACLHNPEADEAEIAHEIAKSPTAFPNTRIVAFADEMMGREGRMVRAAEEICSDMNRLTAIREVMEAEPFAIEARW